MIEHIVVSIVWVLVLGIGAQWLAWRVNIPSILLLLTAGFLAGPVFGLLSPETLQGDWVFAFVSLSIGIILFEGGLSLQLSELREIGKSVRNLITIGVIVTWVLAATAAYLILGLTMPVSILIGAILTVTGPTVVVPLLRQVRPRGRVGSVARWEGITIDPVGAILAVLVVEAIILLYGRGETTGDVADAILHTIGGLLVTIAVGVGVSIAGGALLIVMLRRQLVPDYLQGAFALVIVVTTFALSNLLSAEAGLLQATLFGILLANQKYVPVRRIGEFKENLQVLLIGSLFVLLSARLELDVLEFVRVDTLLFLGVLILMVRPVSVLLSTAGTRLSWKERALLGWLAPRGIVAAAVASLFAFELEGVLPAESYEALVPVVFLVIVGTVAVYGLTISPLARRLGLADPDAQGLLFIGGHPWALQMASAVQKLGISVKVVDTNARNVSQAMKAGLPARRMNVLAESAVDELDLGGIGRLIAVTSNDEINSLAALHFTEVFDSTRVFQLPMQSGSERREHVPMHLRGRTLFGPEQTYQRVNEYFMEGAEVRTVELADDLSYEDLREEHDGDLVLLFVLRAAENLIVNSVEAPVAPTSGDRIVVLVPPKREQARRETPFENLVLRSTVIEVGSGADFREIAAEAADLLAGTVPCDPDRLSTAFVDSWLHRTMVVIRGVALPHCRVPGIGKPEMVLARCRSGLQLSVHPEDPDAARTRTYAFLFLVSDETMPGEHLRILANISNRIGEADFMGKWRAASGPAELRESVLRDDRYIPVLVGEDGQDFSWAGLRMTDLDLPERTHIALVERDDVVLRPEPDLVFAAGDRLTIIGESQPLRQLGPSPVPEE